MNTNEHNKKLIAKFYRGFADGNSEIMAECYHDNISFTDPAFGNLNGDKAKTMWEMLLVRSKGNLEITFSNIFANQTTGKANWIAKYPFGASQRKVVNVIAAEFEFKDGLIIKHIDTFDVWKWSKQALGITGWLLGWSDFMKKSIQKKSNNMLEKYIAIAKN